MTHIYELSDLEMLARDCLTRAGVSEKDAGLVARDVALAEMLGDPDNGFVALLRDIRLIRYGRLHVDARIRVTAPAPTVLRIDAGHGFAAPAVAAALGRLRDIGQREGMGLIHLTRASDPGALAGALIDLAADGLAAVIGRRNGPTYAIAPHCRRVTSLAGPAPGLLDSLLSLAPPANDSPLDGPVASSAWLMALDPEVTAAGEVLGDLPTDLPRTPDRIAVAPDLLAQIVNA